MTSGVLRCDACGATAVKQVRTEPPGVQVWGCAQCGDLKRWCLRCEQGWIRRYRLPVTELEFFSCDECDATWPSGTLMRPPGQDRKLYLKALGIMDAWADPQPVPEREPVPPAA